MTFGWPIVIIGLVSGAVLGLRGVFVPTAIELGWWLERGITLGFFNRATNGDNVGAERLLLALAGLAVGIIGALAGYGLRLLFLRSRRAAL